MTKPGFNWVQEWDAQEVIFSLTGLFLSAKAHKVLVCFVCVCQTEKLQTILIWAPSSLKASSGWRPRRPTFLCDATWAQWAILQENSLLVFAPMCTVWLWMKLTGGHVVWRPPGSWGKGTCCWPVILSSLAEMAGNRREVLSLWDGQSIVHGVFEVHGGLQIKAER